MRERLLRTAMRLFAARGYDGVSVDEIVDAAKINKRMVYHYFGNKEGLYGAVLVRVYEQLETLEERFFLSDKLALAPEKSLASIVEVYFDFLRTHPLFVRLLLWENLQEGRHLALLDRSVNKSPMLRYLEKILAEGVREGIFRLNLDGRKVLISLIGLCLVYFSNRHTLSLTVGLDLSSRRVLKQAAEHTAELLLGGVRLKSPRIARFRSPSRGP